MKAYCTETFGSTKLAPVVAQGKSVAELREGCDQILNILRLNFYLLDYAVTADLGRRILIVSVVIQNRVWSGYSWGVLVRVWLLSGQRV